MKPCINKMGDTAKTINARIQLAVNAMISAATTVVALLANKAKESPTRLLIVEASEDNRAPIAPLQKRRNASVSRNPKTYKFSILCCFFVIPGICRIIKPTDFLVHNFLKCQGSNSSYQFTSSNSKEVILEWHRE